MALKIVRVYPKNRVLAWIEERLPVMSFLVSDVLLNGLARRRADREGRVSVLPAKSFQANLVSHPASCRFLQFPDNVCKAMRGLQSNEQMNVVGDTSDAL